MERFINGSYVMTDVSKLLLKYSSVITFGFINAVENVIPYITFCIILTAVDVWSAFKLSRRLHKMDSSLSKGKFQSNYAKRIIQTLINVFIALLLASFVDDLILRSEGTNLMVRFVAGCFGFIQTWSILENVSSENEKNWAKLLQRIMVNKAERYLDIDLDELKEKKNKKKNV